MREIKFRAWLKSRPTLCKVLSIHFDKITTISVKDGQGKTWFEFGNENAILMQYTGLKDKNGVEIYEGDIVITKFNELHEIKYNERTSQFESGQMWLWALITTPYYVEVIGNIYENPELLEVE